MTIDDMFGLRGKRALITGASRGIGLAYARGLARAGAEVGLNGRDPATLTTAAETLRAEGHTVFIAPFDVTDHAATRAAIDGIEADRGPIDIVVCNAGMNQRGSLEDWSAEDWSRIVATNLDSVFNTAQAAARHMLKRGRGKIITTCSVMTLVSRPGVAPYMATKGAVGNLTKAMATDWAGRGLNVNGIGPGYFATELTGPLKDDVDFNDWLIGRTPAGRWGVLEDLMGACVFLAGPASNFVNGHILYVDGGFTARA